MRVNFKQQQTTHSGKYTLQLIIAYYYLTEYIFYTCNNY